MIDNENQSFLNSYETRKYQSIIRGEIEVLRGLLQHTDNLTLRVELLGRIDSLHKVHNVSLLLMNNYTENETLGVL
jgi:hypothetical protein